MNELVSFRTSHITLFIHSERRRRPVPPTQFVRSKKSKRHTSPQSKKAKAKISFDRDIICLPYNYPEKTGIFPFPRGKVRSTLGTQGLIGKFNIDSGMSENEIFSEIRSVFKLPFNGDEEFPFKILQSAGMGSKSLIVPALSSNYEWKAREVASSGGKLVYIWAQKELHIAEQVYTVYR